jgi:membrane-bound lytic murein transglycosylase B
MSIPLPVATWSELGVRTAGGAALPKADLAVASASLVSGVKRHFLVYPNYQAVLEYNCVNAYGLSVGLLSDKAAAPAAAAKKPAGATKKRR